MKSKQTKLLSLTRLLFLASALRATSVMAQDKLNDTQLKQIEEVVDKAVNPKVSATQKEIERLKKQIELGQPTTEKRVNLFEEASYLSQQIFGTRYLGIPALFNPKDNFNRQVISSFSSAEMQAVGLMNQNEPMLLCEREAFSPRLVLELLAYEMRVPPAKDDELVISSTNEVGNLVLNATVTAKQGAKDLSRNDLATSYKGYSTKDLTAAIHKELNNPNWLSENTRFGALMGYIDDGDAITSQIALRVYPSYHRHIPGRVIDLKNASRRISVIVGIGPTLVQDTQDNQDLGMSYSAGLGFDLTHEVSLFAGYSYYTFTEKESDNQQTDTAFTVGLALNAELFQSFLKGTGN